jgi:hypothetical protein
LQTGIQGREPARRGHRTLEKEVAAQSGDRTATE